jgi:hypothetical protein
VGSAWIAATVRDDDTHREDRQGTAEQWLSRWCGRIA